MEGQVVSWVKDGPSLRLQAIRPGRWSQQSKTVFSMSLWDVPQAHRLLGSRLSSPHLTIQFPFSLHSSSTCLHSSISSLPTALNASFLACPYSSGFLWSSPFSSFHPICPSPATTEAPSYPTKLTQPLLGLQPSPPRAPYPPASCLETPLAST